MLKREKTLLLLLGIFSSVYLFSTKIQAGEKAQSCNGQSVDPSESEIQPLLSLCGQSRRCNESYQGFLALIQKYPLSPLSQNRAAGIALHYIQKPALAREHYQKALQLHRAGCRLNEQNLWIAMEGIALSYLFQADFKNAQMEFEKVVQQWPQSDESLYNLACSYCRNGNLEACASTFEKTLKLGALPQIQPEFLHKARKTPNYWVEKSKTDSDLELLRKDPRYLPLIRKFSPQDTAEKLFEMRQKNGSSH